jgi:hypothetical protein
MPIPKIVKKQSTGEEVVTGLHAIDPSGNLVLVTTEDLKSGWRWASAGDIKAKEAAEAARVKAAAGEG